MKSVRIPRLKRIRCFRKASEIQFELERERYKAERKLRRRRKPA